MKKYIYSLVSISLLIFTLASTQAHALTASDITMLRAAGIISEAQATSLASSVVMYAKPLPPIQVSQGICTAFNNDLSYASKDTTVNNGSVSVLQNFLNAQGYLNATSSGFFGNLTATAVKAFQNAHGISPTGFVGALTRAKIQTIACNGGTASTTTSSVINQMKKIIEVTVPSTISNTIQTQIQNISASATIPTNVPALIQSVSSQIPRINCNNFNVISSCSSLPAGSFQTQCQQCKGTTPSNTYSY